MRAKISNSNYTITVDLRPIPLKPGCQTRDSVSTCTRKHDMMQTLGSAGPGGMSAGGWRVPGQELIMSSRLTTRGESRVCREVSPGEMRAYKAREQQRGPLVEVSSGILAS